MLVWKETDINLKLINSAIIKWYINYMTLSPYYTLYKPHYVVPPVVQSYTLCWEILIKHLQKL